MPTPPPRRRNPAVSVRRVQSERTPWGGAPPAQIAWRCAYDHARRTAIIPPAWPRPRLIGTSQGAFYPPLVAPPLFLGAPPPPRPPRVAAAEEELLARERLAAFLLRQDAPPPPPPRSSPGRSAHAHAHARGGAVRVPSARARPVITGFGVRRGPRSLFPAGCLLPFAHLSSSPLVSQVRKDLAVSRCAVPSFNQSINHSRRNEHSMIAVYDTSHNAKKSSPK